MVNFTEQEKTVLGLFLAVTLLGSGLDYFLKKFPFLGNLAESERAYFKVDLNSAGLNELVRVPYIGPYTAENILRYRLERGPFQSVDDLKKVKGIRTKNFERFRKYLKVSRKNKK